LKVGAVCSPVSLVLTYQTALCHDTEENN